MKGVGEGIAFAGLCIALGLMSTWGDETPVIAWIFVIFWASCSSWGRK